MPQGMLLQALGDATLPTAPQRVALRPGAIWHEQWRGTNAIGTALAEGAGGGARRRALPGAQRLSDLRRRAHHRPRRRLLGVLDISGDQRGYHRHTLGLVRSARA
jgi:transcriptional regulator of acetoin/glycerol metabolism